MLEGGSAAEPSLQNTKGACLGWEKVQGSGAVTTQRMAEFTAKVACQARFCGKDNVV